MSSVKSFNQQYTYYSTKLDLDSWENKTHLHCLLKETIASFEARDVIGAEEEFPLLLRNLHQIVLQFDSCKGPFGKTVELLEKMITTLKNETILKTAPILPVLIDVMLRLPARLDFVLKLIEVVSVGIRIEICEPHLERLLTYCFDILKETSTEEKPRHIALSVIINLCSNNAVMLKILEQQVNFIDLQKMLSLETYGILSCKMNLILHEYGHIMNETDVRNLLKYTTKELHRIPAMDESSLRHLTEFIQGITKRPNTKHILEEYDFCPGIKAAIMTIENSTNIDNFQVNALLEIIKSVAVLKNNPLKKLAISIADFAIKRIKCPEYCIQAMDCLAATLNDEYKITTKNFEVEKMQDTLKALLFANNRPPKVMASLFKLLNALARNYQMNLLNIQYVDKIFEPLLQMDCSQYCTLPVDDVTMFLEFLSTLSILLDQQELEAKARIFQDPKIKFLVAMCVRHGTTDHFSLALSLMNRFQYQELAAIFAEKENLWIIKDSNLLSNDEKTGKDLKTEFDIERLRNVFMKIEEACLSGEMSMIQTSDFIELYKNEISILKDDLKNMTDKYEAISKEYNRLKGNTVNVQASAKKWAGVAENMLRTNEMLTNDITRLNALNASMKKQLGESLVKHEERVRGIGKEKTALTKANKEMKVKLEEVEQELKHTEDLRQTVLKTLMTKRKTH